MKNEFYIYFREIDEICFVKKLSKVVGCVLTFRDCEKTL